MMPNAPHAVFTTEHAICYGGHFYSATTMQDTLSGVIHALVHDLYITNTSHPDMRMMMRRVVVYTHATLVRGEIDGTDRSSHSFNRDNLDADAVKQIYAIIAIGVLSNLLDPRTYVPAEGSPLNLQHDINSMPRSERIGCTIARGMAYEIWSWLTTTYRIRGLDDEAASHDYLCQQLAHTALSLFVAKKVCIDHKRSVKGLTLDSICTQLLGLSASDSPLYQYIHGCLAAVDEERLTLWDSYVPNWDGLTVEKIADASVFEFVLDDVLFRNGASALDGVYYKAINKHEAY
jgi:hypothetical protein